MKYKVKAVYNYERIVDTTSLNFQRFVEVEKRYYPQNTEKQFVEAYSHRELGYQIIDDYGHGTITPSYFHWTVKVEGK